MSLLVHAERVDEGRSLLSMLPELPDDERFAFVRDGEGLVGWGVAARIAVGTGPDRFLRARSGLSEFIGTPASGELIPGSIAEPVAFASFTFDEVEDASVVVVPRIIFRRHAGVTWRITVGGSDAPEQHSSVGARCDAPADRPRYGGSTVRDDLWLDSVASILAAIEQNAYRKVVLARDLHLWAKTDFDVRALLEALEERFPSCYTFLIDHLVGASPEQLLARRGTHVSSRVLAGTAPRGEDERQDAEVGQALRDSEKDLHEHELALTSAVDVLAPICTTLNVPGAPDLVRLDNVQHLGSDLRGLLARGPDGAVPDVLDVVSRLHPTAAVGGAPRDAAVAEIRALEGMSRGRYSGPIGWFSASGDGEFALALRCAEVHGNRARLFAGAGIVAGSTPEAELTETWLKLRAMTEALAEARITQRDGAYALPN